MLTFDFEKSHRLDSEIGDILTMLLRENQNCRNTESRLAQMLRERKKMYELFVKVNDERKILRNENISLIKRVIQIQEELKNKVSSEFQKKSVTLPPVTPAKFPEEDSMADKSLSTSASNSKKIAEESMSPQVASKDQQYQRGCKDSPIQAIYLKTFKVGEIQRNSQAKACTSKTKQELYQENFVYISQPIQIQKIRFHQFQIAFQQYINDIQREFTKYQAQTSSFSSY
eukprot:TRINITY_DN4776_c0_g1_i3.p1 TRINITY_DN4776_c0_g1~~TRINITY_DN4776_c0_g1_i3.p1  ORF type:complete len:229 (-),score=-1.31 TRINITY_DN4776_c0_g1_i3:196-882(-)